jgi:phage tail sheath protein FI
VAYKTPGVYIVEKNAFPNSVVEVATAVPAFVGYTEKADNKGSTLAGKPWRITSMTQFIDYFGGPPVTQFALTAPPDAAPAVPAANDGAAAAAKPDAPKVVLDVNMLDSDKKPVKLVVAQESAGYLLYFSMQLFYQNGGGPCYIVSVGDFKAPLAQADLADGVAALEKEQEPTMVVVPEAVSLSAADCIKLEQAILRHCGEVMKNRFAILDIHNGFRERTDPAGDPVAAFRDALGINNLHFGAAYYPWVDTSITAVGDVTFANLTDDALVLLAPLLRHDMKVEGDAPANDAKPIAKADFFAKRRALALMSLKTFDKDARDDLNSTTVAASDQDDLDKKRHAAHLLLIAFSPVYVTVMTAVARRLNRLPPAAAMAGVYTSVDNTRGVWKAPANVSLNAVIAPAVGVSQDEQQDLNVTTAGKSVNAIRAFIGSGVLVWGARTLDGNSLDWRYVNVRRTMIMLEESLRLAMAAYVFEPNTANTWVVVSAMASSFLTDIWKRGGLAGATAVDAFSVFIGLGQTMTGDDILEGRMKMTILVALSRPAEFIELTFQQQMQKS